MTAKLPPVVIYRRWVLRQSHIHTHTHKKKHSFRHISFSPHSQPMSATLNEEEFNASEVGRQGRLELERERRQLSTVGSTVRLLF